MVKVWYTYFKALYGGGLLCFYDNLFEGYFSFLPATCFTINFICTLDVF